MPVDPRPYITLDYLMPKHDKVQYLSADAFRTLVTAWCYCAERDTDGLVVRSRLSRLGPAKAWQELADEGLTEPDPQGVRMHDYLKHQLSRAERAGLKADRMRASSLANHKRWHKNKGVTAPDCEHCPSATESEPDPMDFPPEIPLGMPSGIPDGIPNDSQTSPKVTTTSKGPSNASRSQSRVAVPAPAPDPHQLAADAAYEAVGKAGKFMAIKGLAKWAMTERGLTQAQFVDAYTAVYRSGRPVLKESLGQYIDGHKRGGHLRSASSYMDAYDEMTRDNPPAIGA